MALTLVEMAKTFRGDDVRSAVIELYARQSDLLRVMPFDEIEGNAIRYNVEDTLPGIGFRGVNEAYTESTGVINPVTETLSIAGGDLDVDKFIVDTQGGGIRATHEAMKIKALAHNWSNTFVKGDSVSSPKSFDGLQVRLTGSQVISNSATAAGGVLSLTKLDEAIDAVDEPTHLLMSKAMRRRLSQAARTSTVGGYIQYAQDEFGRQQTFYNDLPILIADGNADQFATLAFNEAATGGGASTATSIYVLSLREGMLTGIQNGAIDARDLGEIQTKPVFRTRVEWYAGIGLWMPRAASRLRDIADGVVVA